VGGERTSRGGLRRVRDDERASASPDAAGARTASRGTKQRRARRGNNGLLARAAAVLFTTTTSAATSTRESEWTRAKGHRSRRAAQIAGCFRTSSCHERIVLARTAQAAALPLRARGPCALRRARPTEHVGRRRSALAVGLLILLSSL
jgi:hypothetical protein